MFLSRRLITPVVALLAGGLLAGCGGAPDGFADRTSTVTTFESPPSSAAGGRQAIAFMQNDLGYGLASWGRELGFVPADGKWSAAVRPADGVWRVSFEADATHPKRPVRAVWDVDLPFERALTRAEIRKLIASKDEHDPVPRTADARLLATPVAAVPLPGRNVRLVVRLRSVSASGRSMSAAIVPAARLPRSMRVEENGDVVLARGLALVGDEPPRALVRLGVLDGAQLVGRRGPLSPSAFRRQVRREAPVLAYVRAPDVADAVRTLRDGTALPVDQVVLARR